MPLTVRFTPNFSTAQQMVVLPDAGPSNTGLMSALMLQQLNALWVKSGLPLPTVVDRTASVTVTPNTVQPFVAVIPDATESNNGVVSAKMFNALQTLWVASGLSGSAVKNIPFNLYYSASLQTQLVLVPVVTVGQSADGSTTSGLMSSLMAAQLDALVAVPPQLTYTQVITADNPKLWWRFNDASPSTTVLDTEGLANGTLGAGAVQYQQPGLITEAGEFSQGATSSQYSVTSAAIGVGVLPVSSFSIEWWLNTTGGSGNHNFVGFNTNGPDKFFMGVSSGSAGNYQNNHFFQALGNGTFPNAATYFTVTYDGTTVHVYKNGVLISTKVGLIGGNSVTQLLVGKAVTSSFSFAGFIDEVALYDKVLTPTQIAAHYAAGIQ